MLGSSALPDGSLAPRVAEASRDREFSRRFVLFTIQLLSFMALLLPMRGIALSPICDNQCSERPFAIQRSHPRRRRQTVALRKLFQKSSPRRLDGVAGSDAALERR